MDHQRAEHTAREVLQAAVRYHQQFPAGFDYHGSSRGFSVSAESYARLQAAFSALRFDPNASLREGAFASYNQREDQLNFRPENLTHAATRSAMLHELVHAFQDMERFTGLHVEVEATAYLAQALLQAADDASGSLFQRRQLSPHLERAADAPVRTSNSSIYIEAARLCLTLGLDHTPRAIRRADLAPLERALRSSEGYSGVADIAFRGDGLRRTVLV